jgi:hypothetical protein
MSEKITEVKKRRALAWSALVLGLMAFYMLLNTQTLLRPLWQLMDAGMSMDPVNDLRVLLTGIDAYREAGFRIDSELLESKSVENHVPIFNYPSTWLLLAHVPGIANSNALAIAALFYVLFGVTLLRLFCGDNAAVHWWAAAVLFSPSVVLLCERANSDIIVFCMVAWASLGIARSQRICHDIAWTTLFAGAAFLKLFPIAASAAIPCKGGRRRWILFASCITSFAIFVVISRADIERVRHNTPWPTHSSYGARVFIDEMLGNVIVGPSGSPPGGHAKTLQQIQDRLRARSDYTRWVQLFGAAFQGAAVVLCVACAAIGMKNPKQVVLPATLSASDRSLFVAGASVYCFSFIANNNFNYRLVFLLLCVPALVRLALPCTELGSTIPRSILVLIVAVCWTIPIAEPLEYFLLQNLFHWVLAGGLSFLIGIHFGSTLHSLPIIDAQPDRSLCPN